jgi:uncharacterized damage-inducible protein DinB
MLRDFRERLAGTPARLEERLRDLAPDAALAQVDGAWSIQQNAGHLADVDHLWRTRIAELAAGAAVYTPADPAHFNRAALAHAARPLAAVLADFRAGRTALVAAFAAADPETSRRAAHHERLGCAMRLVDVAQFAAEHDDHHLLRIADLRALLGA